MDDKPERSEKETAKRRDEVVRRMINTPPKPHKPPPKEKGRASKKPTRPKS